MKRFASLYLPSFPAAIAYMLQATEYDVKAYLSWLNRTNDFRTVMNRRILDRTSVANAFLIFMTCGILLQLLVAAFCIIRGYVLNDIMLTLIGFILAVTAPIAWAYFVIIPLLVAKRLVINPKLERMRQETKRILANHPGIKIAVAGSYGKTTMKELLATVLAEGLNVAATPGNKNVASAHYQFAKKLKGDEDILIVECGEGKPGDVKQFTETIAPDFAVITGIAPAHLDQYKNVQEAAQDIFNLAAAVKPGNAYVNTESELALPYMADEYIGFNSKGVDGWKVNGVKIDLDGTRFTLKKHNVNLNINSELIGEHLIGVLATTASIADRLKLPKESIEAGFLHTKPYEHRMQPYRLGGAWIIDDAYNGNIQGIEAGTKLLSSLTAKRKIYVTPGLVDQGSESTKVHETLGELVASANPDIVVLMKNSVTDDIMTGLAKKKFDGEIFVQADPLVFYMNLDQFVAAGDIVLLQNDWTDNYR